jgi:hypothetical protein
MCNSKHSDLIGKNAGLPSYGAAQVYRTKIGRLTLNTIKTVSFGSLEAFGACRDTSMNLLRSSPLTPPPPLRKMSDVRNEYFEGLREWVGVELAVADEEVD